MNDARSKRRLEDIARDIERRAAAKRDHPDVHGPHREPPPEPRPPREGAGRIKIVATVAGAALLFVAGWGFGHASPACAWARIGVRGALERLDVPQVDPAPSVAAPDNSAAPPAPEASASAAADDAADEGDSISDLLAEAAAHAKLAAASDAGAVPPDVTADHDSAAPGAAVSASAAPTRKLGSATRMRQIGEQLVALCQSGHAEEVRPLAEQLLAEGPQPWIASRVRAACHIEPPAAE